MELDTKLTQRFLASVREKRVASAYIIEGLDGVGKLFHARFFASALCCLSPKADAAPCGVCKACRSIARGEYIDVSEIRPESADRQITVDAVRGVISDVSLLPSEADWRIFIVEKSENMNGHAQNALLKSMEEPPAGVVFFLLTSNKKALLPTVISRSVSLQVTPPSPERLKEILAEEFPQAEEEKILSAVALSGGSQGRAGEILQGGELFSLCSRVADYLEAISNSGGLGALMALFPPKSQNRQSLSAFLPMLKLGLRDVILFQKLKGSCLAQVFTDTERLSRVALGIPPKKAAALFDCVEELMGRLALNVNSFAAVSQINLLACSKS